MNGRRLSILASGTGSHLQVIINKEIPVHLLITDRECRALEIAQKARIPYVLLQRLPGKDFNHTAYTSEIIGLLQHYEIDLVAMAGFKTILAPTMFIKETYSKKVLNVHPSLLPLFKGGRAVHDALEAGITVTGCTVHWATSEVDGGPIIAQKRVEIFPGDTVTSLHERIKGAERELYPAIIRQELK